MAIVSSLGFLLTAIASGLLLTWYLMYQLEQNERHEIGEFVETFIEHFEEGGLEEAIARANEHQERIVSDEEAHNIFSEGDPVFVLLNADADDVLAGYSGIITNEDGWSESVIEFKQEEYDVEVIRFRMTVDERLAIVVAYPRTNEYYLVQDSLRSGFYWLFVIAIPLALLTGFVLSARVFKRLNEINETVEQIGHDTDRRRIALSSNKDEFDRLGANLNAMLDRIEELHQNIESMSVGVAHDLKTPLTRVSNYLQLMAQDIHEPNKLEAHLDNVDGQVQNILRIIQSLLRLGEIESGKRRSAFKKVDLSSLLEDSYESYQPVFDENNKNLTTSIIPNITIEADKELLTQLVYNLLENMIEHSQANAQAWIRLQSHRGGAVLQIGDNGPGVDIKDRERIFERFYRADKSRSTPGNGLGLSIVSSIAKLHDADIVLLDDQAGAVFDIYFKTQPPH
jgi:signal transduction histidine kinase